MTDTGYQLRQFNKLVNEICKAYPEADMRFAMVNGDGKSLPLNINLMFDTAGDNEIQFNYEQRPTSYGKSKIFILVRMSQRPRFAEDGKTVLSGWQDLWKDSCRTIKDIQLVRNRHHK